MIVWCLPVVVMHCCFVSNSGDFGGNQVRMRRQHGLPEAVKATGTTKVFNEYLTCLTYSPSSRRIACIGDRGVKVIIREGAELDVLVDHTLEYELTIGHITRIEPPASEIAPHDC